MAEGFLARVLGPDAVAPFLDRHWGRAPHIVPGGAAAFVALADLDLGARLAATTGASVLVARAGTLHDGGPPATAEAARALHAEGFTLVIRHAERHDPGLAALATEVGRELGGAVDIHGYCTPAGGRGFGWHYDAEEVFILQCVGGKHWRLRANTLDPRPTVHTLPRDMQFERETSPIWLDATLATGDALYIPAGWWHRGEGTEASVSLAVGVMPPTALDVLVALRDHLAGAPLWRLRLPPSGTAHGTAPDALAAAWRDALDLLGDDLGRTMRDDAFLQALLRRFGAPGSAAPDAGAT